MTEQSDIIDAVRTMAAGSKGGLSRRRLIFLAPAAGLVALSGTVAWGLTRNPQEIPSAPIGKPVSKFSPSPVEGRTLGLASEDLRDEVSLINVFASWCAACREEHPLFMRIAADRTVPLHGLNDRDQPDDAAEWLDTLGDPYTRTGAVIDGRGGIDWEVHGVPETFVVGADGRIAHKQIGPRTATRTLDETILPLVERLRTDAQEQPS